MSQDQGASPHVSIRVMSTWARNSNSKAFSASVLPKKPLYVLENGCHNQTSTDLVSHSFSVISMLWSDWMLLCGVTNARSKEPGVYLTVCAGMCVCVCGVPANAVRSQSDGRGSTRLHEDESVSWSARAKIPPHTLHLDPSKWFDL